MENRKTYLALLKSKLREQEAVYNEFKLSRRGPACYKGSRHEIYGMRDENDTGRLRLAYYLLYKKPEDEEDEGVIAALFEEELKDRETNSFQGIGMTLQILTQLLRKYNGQGKYDPLFKRAKEANFDCACGYDAEAVIDGEIESNDLLDCIFLAQDMDFTDIMGELVDQWKETITDWDQNNRKTLIRFNRTLGREKENEELYQQSLAIVKGNKEMRLFDIVSAYSDLIGYHIEVRNYEAAYRYLNELLNGYQLDEVRPVRLYASLLEHGLEIMTEAPGYREELWLWIRPELENRRNKFGNLYQKGIAAARMVDEPFAQKLEAEYAQWRKEVGIT